MRVTIHQPDHLGYLGLYHKIMNAEKYVVLDNVQFAKREFIHRNRIRGAEGALWLSVPVLTKATELLIAITKAVGGTSYLAGSAGKDYLDESLIETSGIQLEYDQFIHPVYEQVYEPFLRNMAIIDLMFNCGPRAIDALRAAGPDGRELEH